MQGRLWLHPSISSNIVLFSSLLFMNPLSSEQCNNAGLKSIDGVRHLRIEIVISREQQHQKRTTYHQVDLYTVQRSSITHSQSRSVRSRRIPSQHRSSKRHEPFRVTLGRPVSQVVGYRVASRMALDCPQSTSIGVVRSSSSGRFGRRS